MASAGSHSQILWPTDEVWKGSSLGAHLTAKAYNARVIVAWLASCLQIAVGEEPAQPGRLCGLWISENGREWPQHDLLLPSAVAMNLELA